MKNPFTLSFGKKPTQFIPRLSQVNELVEDIMDEDPSSQAYMITGVRGSGKTVMMTLLYSKMDEEDDWYAIELNPETDLLQSFAAKLYQLPGMSSLFVKAKIDLSLLGIGLSIEKATPISDLETAIERMLDQIKKAGKHILILMDEVVGNDFVRPFVSEFQILIRREYPVFLVMTGLYENLYNLQNDKSLTFLYRTPKVYLEPLNFTAMRKVYAKVFDIDVSEAEKLASWTKGYPFAFQVLGYIKWEHGEQSDEDLLADFDMYMSEYVYEKIWSELSPKDRSIVICVGKLGDAKVKELRESLNMDSNEFSVYRDRLKRKGIVDVSQYGKISFVLPRFDVFVHNKEYMDR